MQCMFRWWGLNVIRFIRGCQWKSSQGHKCTCECMRVWCSYCINPLRIHFQFPIMFLSSSVLGKLYMSFPVRQPEKVRLVIPGFWTFISTIWLAGPQFCTCSPHLFSGYLSCPRAMLWLQQSVTALPSLLVGWDHYYWHADGPAGQGWRVYLWLCVGAVVCIPCHALCPGTLPGPHLVSDEQTVAATGMTGWDPGARASLRVWRKREDGFRGIERLQSGGGVNIMFILNVKTTCTTKLPH